MHLGKITEIGGDEYSAETVSFSLKDRTEKVGWDGERNVKSFSPCFIHFFLSLVLSLLARSSILCASLLIPT